jgi:hypothetical protein
MKSFVAARGAGGIVSGNAGHFALSAVRRTKMDSDVFNRAITIKIVVYLGKEAKKCLMGKTMVPFNISIVPRQAIHQAGNFIDIFPFYALETGIADICGKYMPENPRINKVFVQNSRGKTVGCLKAPGLVATKGRKEICRAATDVQYQMVGVRLGKRVTVNRVAFGEEPEFRGVSFKNITKRGLNLGSKSPSFPFIKAAGTRIGRS